MSRKSVGFEGSGGSSGENVQLPYPETSALPDVGKIMKDLGIASSISQGIPESSSQDDMSVKPGGLGFEGFFGRPGDDVGFPSCEPSGEFPNVEKIIKDLSIDSPVSQEIPELCPAAPKVLDSPSHLYDVGFKEEVLNKNQEHGTKKKLPDVQLTASEKKCALAETTKKADIGKQS